MLNDVELRQAILDLDRDAMEYVCKEYESTVYNYALKILKSEEDAEDFTQDFFPLLLYGYERNRRGIEAFDPDRGSLSTFIKIRLRGRVYNRYNQLRTERQRHVPIDDKNADPKKGTGKSNTISPNSLIAYLTGRSAPDKEVELQELKEIIDKVIKELTEKCQDTIILYYIKGHTGPEIANLRNIPINTIRSRIFNCFDSLKTLLTQRFTELCYEPY